MIIEPKVRQLVTPLCVLLGFTVAACGPSDRGPQFDSIGQAVGFVGSELIVELRASDPDADPLTFSYEAPTLHDISARADIRPYGQSSSEARFHWRPIAQDVGSWPIDFIVTDGEIAVRETVTVEIKAAVGTNDSPMFVQPLGSGVELDLGAQKCVEVQIEIEDPDSSSVEVEQGGQLIDGAVLMYQPSTQRGKWSWCPTQGQIDARNVYVLTLIADDGESQATSKTFFITLKKAQPMNCPGTAPVITHAPAPVSSVLPIPLRATITDDKGVQGAPILRYALTQDGAPMTLPATRESGDAKSGVWVAEMPNPVAAMPANSMVTVFYSWVAQDNDDEDGTCDHTATAPASGSYQMRVTNPGTTGNLMLCEACTADAQCGGANDHCIRVGGMSYCGRACTGAGDGDCPTNYTCSAAELTSVDGVTARQCVPKSGDCGMVEPPTCSDDAREDNDTRAQASAQPALAVATTHSMKMCPATEASADEDYYKIVVEGEARINVNLTGGTEMNLDLQLLDAEGVVRGTSGGATSNETVEDCVPAGTYFIHVYSTTTTPREMAYGLSFGAANTSCAPTCTDDEFEPDNTFADGWPLLPELFEHDEVTDRTICEGDDDYYWIELKAGDTLYATLRTPDPEKENGDLDFHFYRGMADTTPCTLAIPCTAERGQSASADENAVYHDEITVDGDYYLVVTGYNGATNDYDICVSLEAGKCPPPP